MLSPNPSCSFCGCRKNLSRCAACKVTQYCCRDHHVSDRNNHSSACKAIKRARSALEREDQRLRNSPGDWMSPENPLENSVGHFWGSLCTRDYMRARYASVEALLKVKTFDAVRSAAEHIRDCLRLNRSDNMGVRYILPALYMRLGRDQDAYDFIKWWGTCASSNYDFGDTSLPYLDLFNADVFEWPTYLCKSYPDLSSFLYVALLKIKLLLDLEALDNSAFLSSKLPQELADKVRLFIPKSEIVWKNRQIMRAAKHHDQIKKLSCHVRASFDSVTGANRHFWPALLEPGSHLLARPEAYRSGSVEEMRIQLHFWFDAWNETPGSIAVIRSELGEHD